MKDFPLFTTQNGAASLILKEVPYRGESYIHLRSSREPEKLLEECVSFCRVCGAERIYATGSDILKKYPLHTRIIEMRGKIIINESNIPNIIPVIDATVTQWREIYNRKMKTVANAATLERKDEKEILESGGAYFIYESEIVQGIGWLIEDEIRALAACVPGAGERICKALQSIIPQQTLHLQVASTNQKAIRLYEKVGMRQIAEISSWYRVF